MKKITLFILFVIGMITVNAQIQNPAGYTGNGTSDSPFQIWTAQDLDNLRLYIELEDTNLYYKIMDNIDLYDYINNNYPDSGWNPIGFGGKSPTLFHGNIDGNNKTISGLWSNFEGSYYVGLFSFIRSVTIKNLNIITDDVIGVRGSNEVGILAGMLEGPGRLVNCKVSGIVHGEGYTGGFIGSVISIWAKTIITECSSNIQIYGMYNAGGLIGYMRSIDSISKCHSQGEFTMRSNYPDFNYAHTNGGFVGQVYDGAYIYECYSNVNLSGMETDTYLTMCGGFIGRGSYCRASNCYSTGLVAGATNPDQSEFVGGFCGLLLEGTKFINCYSVGQVLHTPTIKYKSTGGFLGGYIGPSNSDIQKCYYDTVTSMINTNMGAPHAYCAMGIYPFVCSIHEIIGSSTSAMQQQLTFEGWDFDNIWKIEEGVSYPTLKWQTEDTSSVPEPEHPCFAGGDGTEENPYLIANAAQLDCFIDYAQEEEYEGAHYRIIQDIDVYQHISQNYPQTGWRGNELQEFTGYLHGGGHIISGIWGYYADSETVGGLFASISMDGIVDSLGIIIEGRGIVAFDEVGGFVGRNEGEIFSCFTIGGSILSLNSVSGTGGFVGTNERGDITNCYSTVMVVSSGSNTGYTGGLVGYNYRGRIEGCYSTGNIVAPFNTVGALVGYNYNTTNHNIAYNYFDTQSSRQNIAIGQDNRTNTRNDGMTTAQMKDENELVEFDFEEIWKLLPGCYPILQWQDGSIAPRSISIFSEEENIRSTINIEETVEINVYPNPTTGTVTVETTEENPIIQVFDANGNMIINTTSTTIDLSSYPNGPYIFSINGETRKIIKQ